MSSPNPLFGYGLVSPLRREGKDFVAASGAGLVTNCIQNILGTVAAQPGVSGGELPWAHTFGSRLSKLRHRNLGPTTDALARFYVEEALRTWEPRVKVVQVTVEDDQARNTRYILVDYSLITDNVAANQVVLPGQSIQVEI